MKEKINLIELAERLTVEDLVELMARMACCDSRNVAKDVVKSTTVHEDDKAIFRDILSNQTTSNQLGQRRLERSWFLHV